ncbi:MAG TPA: aspartate aminotransferase family protein [Terriglobia bacterium]|nr:aspartate aminotransferase family protein [Terriglobia bacterium]
MNSENSRVKTLKSYAKSLEFLEEARHSLAGGVSSQFRAGEIPHPLFYARAEGARLWDVDGNEFLDFTLSQGPMLLGHSHPAVLQAVCEAISSGQLYAAQHSAEVELAETLKRLIPCAELVRFSLSGSEAVHAALRVSRAYTRRPKFIKFEGHYHGWFDNVSFSVSPSLSEAGPPDNPSPVPWTQGISPGLDGQLIICPWNDLERVQTVLRKRAAEVAAVIMEPVMCNNGCILPNPGFLEGVREACDRHGVALIFDEVITGFRISPGGAQKYFGVVPDLAVFGKAMASGFPVSAIVGKREIMDRIASGGCIHAGTLNAQNAAVAAALATLRELQNPERDAYTKLFKLGDHLREGLQKAGTEAGHKILVQGIGPVFHAGFTELKKATNYRDTLSYDKAKYGEFCSRMRERGIRLIGRGLWYVSTAHTLEDIEQCIKAARESFAEISKLNKQTS